VSGVIGVKTRAKHRRANRVTSERQSGSDEDICFDCRTALDGVASRSASRYIAEPTTVGRSEHPVRRDRSPKDWRFLQRGNDRDILQRTQRPERRWLRAEGRVDIEQWGRIKWRFCTERWRWRHQLVHPAMR